MGDVILHGKKKYWMRGGNFHYHLGLQAGENTLEAQLVRVLSKSISDRGIFDANDFRERYMKFMTTPGSHNDTYASTCHRMFFANLVKGNIPSFPTIFLSSLIQTLSTPLCRFLPFDSFVECTLFTSVIWPTVDIFLTPALIHLLIYSLLLSFLFCHYHVCVVFLTGVPPAECADNDGHNTDAIDALTLTGTVHHTQYKYPSPEVLTIASYTTSFFTKHHHLDNIIIHTSSLYVRPPYASSHTSQQQDVILMIA